MASEIDKRVVQMQFDNKDFEKNCQTSLSTLEKLKMALNFDGAKGLESMAKAANKVDLSNLSKGAESVSVKFNAMHVVGITVISDLTRAFMNFGKNLWNMTFGQMKTGGMSRALNIEQANFKMRALAKNIKGIGEDTAKIDALMDRIGDSIDRAVTGTAYGYDAAANVASQLMASGLTNADKMYDYLRGIAGAAAMTGRSFEDIGNIFATVASNGRLMTMQLRQFSASGVNIAAVLAQQMGTTEAAINDLVHDGKISFEQFADAINKAFGESAGKADEMYSGVLTNVKAQLSRIGQLFAEPYIKNMIPVLQQVKASIKELNKVLKPVAKTFEKVFKKLTTWATEAIKNLDLWRLESLIAGIENILVSIAAIIWTIFRAISETFSNKNVKDIHKVAMSFEEMTKALMPSKKTLEGLKEIIKVLLIPFKLLFEIAVSFMNVLQPLIVNIALLFGSVIRLGVSLAPIVNTLFEIIEQTHIMEAVFKVLAGIIYTLAGALTDFIFLIAEFLNEFSNSTTFYTFLETLKTIAKVINYIVVYSLLTIYDLLNKLLEKLYEVGSDGTSALDKLAAGFSWIVGVLNIGIQSILNIIKGLAESGTFIGDLFKTIKNFFGLIVAFIKGDNTDERVKELEKSLNRLKKTLKKTFVNLQEFLNELTGGKVLVYAFAIVMIFLLGSFVHLLERIADFVRWGTKMFSWISRLTAAFRAIARYAPLAIFLISFSFAIGSVTSALVTLSRDIDPERLKEVAIVLGAFAGGLMAFALAVMIFSSRLKMVDNAAGLAGISLMMIGLSSSLLLLANALKVLSNVSFDLEQMAAPLITIISLIIVLTGAAIAISNFAPQLGASALSILSFAVAISILSNSLKKFNEIGELNTKAIITFVGMISTLALAVSVVGLSKLGAGAGLAILQFSISLLVILGVLSALTKFKVEDIVSVLKGLCLIFAPILTFVVMAAGVAAVSGPGFFKDISATLLGFNLLIVLMVGSVALLGSMSPEMLTKGLLSIFLMSKILLMITDRLLLDVGTLVKDGDLFLKVERVMWNFKGMLLSFAASVAIISLATLAISKVSFGDIIKMGILIIAISSCIGFLSEMSKEAHSVKASVILSLFVGIGLIFGAIALFTLLATDNLKSFMVATAAVILILLAIGVIFGQMRNLSKKTTNIDANIGDVHTATAGMVLAIVGIIGSLAALAYVSRQLKRGPLLVLITTLGVIFLAIFELMRVAKSNIHGNQFAKNLRSMSILFAAIGGMVGVIALSMGAMSQMASSLKSPEQALYVFGALAILCGEMFALAIWLAKSSKNINGKNFVVISAGVVILAAAMGIIAAAIGGMIYVVGPAFFDFESVAVAVGALVVPLVTIFGFFALASKWKWNGVEMIKIATSFLIMVTALAGIAAAIGIMAELVGGSKLDEVGQLMQIIYLLSSFIAVAVVMASMMEMMRRTNVKSTDMILISTSVVIMTTSLGLIAGALYLISMAISNVEDYRQLGNMAIGLVTGFLIIAGALVLMTKLTKSVRPGELLAVAGSLPLASLAFLTIAATMAILSEINVDDNFDKKMYYFIQTLGLFGLVMIALTGMSKNGNWSSILAASASMSVAALSILIIAESMKTIVKSTKGMKPNELDSVMDSFLKLIGILSLVVIIGGALGSIDQGSVGVGMMLFAVSLAAVGVAILAFAVAADLFVDAIMKINEVDLDADRLKNNLITMITSSIDAFWETLPKIITIVLAILGVILGIIMLYKNRAAVTGIMYLLAFGAGLVAAMPELLKILGSLMDEIIEWLNDEENMKKIETFFSKIGELLVHIILGAFAGVIKAIDEALDPLVDKWMAYKNSVKHEELLSEATDQRVKDFLDYYGPDEGKKRDIEDYAGMIFSLNRQMDALVQDGKDANVEYYKELAKSVGLPIKYLKYLKPELASTTGSIQDYVNMIEGGCETVEVSLEELNSGVADTSHITSGTLTKESEEIKNVSSETSESVKDDIASVVESTDEMRDKVEENVEETGKSAIDKVKDVGSNMGNSLIGGFNGLITDANNFDISGMTEGLLPMAEMSGASLGKAQGKAMKDAFGEEVGDISENSIEFWEKDAQKTVWTTVPDENFVGPMPAKWKLATDSEGNHYATESDYVMDNYNKNKTYAQQYADDLWGSDDTDEIEDGTDAILDMTDAMGGLGDEADSTKKKTKSFAEELRDSIKKGLNIFNEVTEDEMISPEEMLYRMSENTRKVGEWARNISLLAARGMSEGLLNQLKDMGPEGAAKVKAFVNMTDEQLQMANRRYAASAALPDYATKEIVKSYKDAGFNASLGFANGIDSSAANDAMTELGTNSLDALKTELDEHSPSRKTEEMGKLAVEGLANGLKDQASQNMIRAASKMVAGILLKSLEQDLRIDKLLPIGSNILNGIGMGVDKGTPTLLSKINSLASRILGAFAKVLVIHSPSKAMAELGEYAMEGFGEGMEDGSTNVESLSEKTANDILDAMKANIASVTDGWSEDNVYSPVIRPVFDMDAINQGYTDIQTWFANAQGLNLNGNISRLTPTSRDETDTNQQLIDAIKSIDNDRVVDELVALRNDISDLQSAMSNMQVVMNSGALVGQIVDDMDRALGSKAVLNSRGRY